MKFFHKLNFAFFIAITSLILAVISGCSSELPDIPDIGVSTDKMNRDIVLVSSTLNSNKIDESLTLYVQLVTDNQVISPYPSFNARMFTLSERQDQWIEVQSAPALEGVEMLIDGAPVENPEYYVLSRSNSDDPIYLFPMIYSLKPTKLLITVTGNVYEDGEITDKKVGAYTIVTLKP